MNINRLLENSKRISLIGKNIYTFEGYTKKGEWELPSPGLSGVCIGHQIDDFKGGVCPEFYEKGQKLQFEKVRHRWTPAWQETYYRSTPDSEYYLKSGCISFCERKCITQDDVFCSHIVLQSDKREATEISVKLVSPPEGEFNFKIKIGALTRGKPIDAKGYISVKNTVSSENEFTLSIPANGSIEFSYSFAFSKDSLNIAEKKATDILENSAVFSEREEDFNKFMSDYAPKLTTENVDILKIYYYRWFLIYRAIHNPIEVIKDHPIKRHCIYESPYGTWYGCPVGLPVPCHTEETKWMTNPEFVYSNTLNWVEGLCYYQEYIQYTPMAIWHLYLNHPNKKFLNEAYNSCFEFTIKRFNPQNEGLEFFKTTEGSWITGAEYQPAFYQHKAEKWDWTCDVEGVRNGLSSEISEIYRLDDISYSIGNLMGCIGIAKELGMDDECKKLSELINKARKILKEYFWCEDKKCFVSIDAATKKQCDEAICYDSFFPYLWDIIDDDYNEGLRALGGKENLSCTFGVTTVDKQCPMYWFDNCIAGPAKSSIKEPHPYGCSWNGPVWPYALSGDLEALGCKAVGNRNLGELWNEIFDKYTELHFMEGDRSTPMVTEHYRPTDGNSFSSTCDYFHSTWIDLFMKYWAGIGVSKDGVEFLPITKEEFTISNVMIGGKKYEFTQKNTDGKLEKSFKVI